MLREQEKQLLKEVLKEGVDTHYVAGANLLVLQNGKEIYYDEAGYADLEEKKKIKRDSLFRMYSMTKPVTAAAVMILLQRGKIDLYDPISQYLKGFQNQKVEVDGKLYPLQREVTIKDLLFMTSGLVYGGTSLAGKATDALFEELKSKMYTKDALTTKEAMNKLGSFPLQFQPGSNWEYGTSADVLAALVEVVSKKRYSDFLKEEIFFPLGMLDTDFWVPKEKQHRLTKTYEQTPEKTLKLYTQNHLAIMQKMDIRPSFESGGAGLVSTIDDYARFATMLMQQGTYDGVEILRPKTVQFMTHGTLTPQQQKGLDTWDQMCGYTYGNLMRHMKDPSKAGDFAVEGEYGWDGWLGAYMANIPKEKLTILFMIQKKDSGTNALTRKLKNIILSSL